jgi:CRP-like cAMP-binding protein
LKGSVEGPKGKVTTWFKKEGDLLLPQSLFNRQASPEYVSAVTESTLYMLPLAQLQKLMAAFPEAAELFLLLAWETIRQGQYREILLRIPAAKDRYNYFTAHEGYLLKQTPHHLIASYLNVTRETFSRIHKGLAY